MRKKIREAPHLVFKDEHGRFVAQKDRYRKARTAFVVAAKKMPGGIKKGGLIPLLEDRGRPITPSRLSEGAARMLSRQKALQAVEAIDPNFSGVERLVPKAKVFTAWNLAGQLDHQWGIKGKKIHVTMNLYDGKKLRRVSFYHHMRRDSMQVSLWMHMNEALGLSGLFLYDKVGNRRIPGRSGRQVRLHSVDYSIEL